jgi:hypothetical protein
MKLLKYLLPVALCSAVHLRCAAQSKAPLFFREDWKEIEAQTPVTQEHVENADLVLTLYGPGRDSIRKSNHPQIPNDPYYVWSGECKGNWAVGLRHRSKQVDLTGNAAIDIRTRQSGFRQLRVIVRLSSGEWLVSDQSVPASEAWTEKRFRISEIHWRKLNMENVTEGAWDEHPDLSKVEEIGFTDLMAGGGTPASSRLDWIAVYGKSVKH